MALRPEGGPARRDAAEQAPEQPDPSGPAGLHLARVRALDGLRGVAVLAVLLFHDGHLRGGYLGVDLFFVLSGYLITSLLLLEHGRRGRVRLRRFYERRARRLLPALGIALVGVALYAVVYAAQSELSRIRGDGIATLFYYANWREIVTKQNYWDLFRAPSPLQHSWSLSIEEQFYAIWPLVVLAVLARVRSARAVFVTALALATGGAVFTLVEAAHHGDQRLLYYGTASRAPALLLGAALAAAVVQWGTVTSRRWRAALEVLAVVAAAYLAYAWTHQSGSGLSLYRGPLLLCGLAATVVIAAAAHPRPGPIAAVLSWRPLVGAGLISYGLYLYHWPLYLVLTSSRTGLSGWWLLLLRVAVSVAVAVVSYLLVEQPVRKGVPRRAGRALALLGSATVAVVVVLVVATAFTPAPISANPSAASGWPRAVAAVTPSVGARPYLPPGNWALLTNACETARPLPALQPIGPTTQPRVMVVGDSVGCFVGAGLDVRQQREHVVTLNRSTVGCPLVASDRQRDTDGTVGRSPVACIDAMGPAVATFRPDVAVLMAGGLDVAEPEIAGRFVAPCDPAFESWYRAGARRSIDVLAAGGAPVVVVSIVHPPLVIDVGPGISVPSEYQGWTDCENRALREAADAAGARWLDLDAYLCPQGHCRASLGGVTLRPDGRHFQGPAANVVAAWMLPRVLSLAGVHPSG